MTSRRALLISLGLLALIAIAYFPVRHFDFVPVDDPLYVSENPHVLGGLTWPNIAWAFTSRWGAYWIPLTWISYMAEIQLFGLDPGVQHVTNVLLHAANTLLLFLWLRKTTGATWRSAAVAGFFALHPLHVESVAWITERKDVLSSAFLLLALISYGGYVRRPTPVRYLAVCACFIAGVLAKPMLVTLPFILLLCDVWPLERVRLDVRAPGSLARWRAVVWEKWPLFAMAAGASVVAFITQDRGGAIAAQGVYPLGLRLANALTSYVWYLRQMVWPEGLIVIYPYPASIPAWQVVGAVVVLVAASWAVLRQAATRPYLGVGWFWYLGTLVPVIGIVQIGLQPRADRFTYVPLIGIFIIIAWGAAELAARSRVRARAAVAVGTAALLACTAASRRQVESWKDGVTLFGRAAEITSHAEAARAQVELGSVLLRHGRTDEAIAHYREAVRDNPDDAEAHASLGMALAQAGRVADAELEDEAALRLDSNLPEVQNNLGALLAGEGKLAEAVPHFEAAVRLKPDLESARVNLGVALVRVGDREGAIRELRAALALNPSNAQARHVLDLLTRSGK